MAETAGDGTSIRYLYDADGALTGLITDGVTYYYVKDVQGDIMAIVDGQGVVKARYAYTAYGAVTVNDEPGTDIGTRNPYRYRGYYYDSETGLYALQSRYYDPQTGRFINADGQLNADSLLGYNMFEYCENNPANMADYDGKEALRWCSFVAGCVAWILLVCYAATSTLSHGIQQDWKKNIFIHWEQNLQ